MSGAAPGVRVQASARDRRALWIGAAIIVPVLLWRLAIAPSASALARASERATAARELLAREQAMLRDAPRLPAREREARARAANEAPRLFGGADTVAATAALAAWARDAAVGAGLRNAQASAAPVETVTEGVASVGVDLRAEGSFAALAAWIELMESGERLLAIERLDIAAAGAEGAVSVNARVRGYAAVFAAQRHGGRR